MNLDVYFSGFTVMFRPPSSDTLASFKKLTECQDDIYTSGADIELFGAEIFLQNFKFVAEYSNFGLFPPNNILHIYPAPPGYA